MTKTFAFALTVGVAGCSSFPRHRPPPSENQLDAMHAYCADRFGRRSFIEARTPRSIGTLPAKSTSDERVVIYGASWCQPCAWAKAYLTRRGIPWVEKDIDDEAVRSEMNELLIDAAVWNRGIPVVVVRDVVMTGFMPCGIDEALRT